MGSRRKPKAVKTFDYGNADDYDPIIKVHPKQEQTPNGGKTKKILRPRYASTELGIKEKLFIGVLTSRDTIDSLGVAVNKTLTHYVPKLVFFMDTRGLVFQVEWLWLVFLMKSHTSDHSTC